MFKTFSMEHLVTYRGPNDTRCALERAVRFSRTDSESAFYAAAGRGKWGSSSPLAVTLAGGAMPPVREGSLFLEVRDRMGSRRLAWLEPQLLFGSKAVGGSLQSIARGERALIRVPGHWRTSHRETSAILREPNGVVQVSAVLHVVQEQLLVRAVNGLVVSVRDHLRH
jgi:hypothetical protein